MTSTRRTIGDGLTVGLIAYAAVAGFYAIFDLLAARGTLYTVNLLGRSLFRGLRDPAVLATPLAPDMAAIAWYNGLHLVASLGIGLVVTWLVGQAERRPSQVRPIQLAIVAGFVATILGVGLLTAPLRPLLPWWSIVVANALSVVLAGAYLVRKRPGTWRRLASLSPTSG